MPPKPAEPQRWQYRVVNLGSIDAAHRLALSLGRLGAAGWELISVFDKSSNWIGGMEKGFALFKRPVAPGVEPDEPWAVVEDSSGDVTHKSTSADDMGGWG